MVKSVDARVQAAYESLGDELEKYLTEAGEMAKHHPPQEQHGMMNPLASVFKGFGDMGKSFFPQEQKAECPDCHAKITAKTVNCDHCGKQLRKLSRSQALKVNTEKDEAKEYLERRMYEFVKRFKAAHGFRYGWHPSTSSSGSARRNGSPS